MTLPDKLTPETLRGFADLTESKTLARYATAWAADRKRAEERYAHLERDFDIMRHAKQDRIEELVREKRRLQGRLDAASLWAVKAAVVLANEFQSLLRGEEER
jgi:hypothetical protein